MADRPILFSAPMVRALLDGTKTQTRRVVKPQFAADAEPAEMCATNERGHQISGHSGLWWDDTTGNDEQAVRCPYGQPRDRLWVREAWAPGDDMVFGVSKDDPETVLYRADKAALHWDGKAMATPMDTYAFNWDAVRWRPSIHMPRFASRITLEVTAVRVERLQDISEADAIAEGIARSGEGFERFHVDPEAPEGQPFTRNPVLAYKGVWEQINGAGSWDENPWVWAITFRRV